MKYCRTLSGSTIPVLCGIFSMCVCVKTAWQKNCEFSETVFRLTCAVTRRSLQLSPVVRNSCSLVYEMLEMAVK